MAQAGCRVEGTLKSVAVREEQVQASSGRQVVEHMAALGQCKGGRKSVRL